MSWEAVTWANKQKLKKSFEQIVLLVVANCADPNGEAFVKWPGKDHWWKYLCDRTRLPKSSLFRHLNTLVALGLCERSTLILSDGTKRPTLKLSMAAAFDIEFEQDQELYASIFDKIPQGQSPPGTGDSDDSEADQNDSDISHSEAAFETENPQSPPETGSIPSAGNGSFPVAGMHRDSKNLSNISTPTPPPEGTLGQSFEDFTKAWVKPIERISVAEKVWDHIPTDRRGEAIAAARGYRAFVDQQHKKPPLVSAQTFLREPKGWPQWLPYAPDASGIAPSINTAHRIDSPAGKAIVALYQIAGCEQALRSFMIRGNAVNYRMPVNPRLLALAEKTERDAWVVLRSQQAAAWNAMIRDMVTVQARQPLKEGDRAPHPWPPKVDGTWSPTGDPPQAETLMSEQDMADFH